MPDLHDRLRDLDLLEVPDVMHRARGIEPGPPVEPGTGPARRVAIAAFALLLAVATFLYATRPFDRTAPTPAGTVECRWIETPYDLPIARGVAREVAGTSPDDLWITVDLPDDRGTVLLHHVAGSWEETPMPASDIVELEAVMSGELFALTTNGLAIFDGLTWVEHDPRADLSYPSDRFSLNSMDVLARDDVWVAVDWWIDPEWVPIILHWDGQAWSESYRPAPGEDDAPNLLGSVSAWGPGDVWAAGAREVGPDASGDLVPVALHLEGERWRVIEMPDRAPGRQQHTTDAVLATGPSRAFVATGRGIFEYTGTGWVEQVGEARYGWKLEPGATGVWGLTVSMNGTPLYRWDGTLRYSHAINPSGREFTYDLVSFGDTAVGVGGPFNVAGDTPPFAIRVDC